MGDFDIAAIDEIVHSLNGTRSGLEWRCDCPVHHGHSLCIRTSAETGKVLLKCWGGDCSFTDIMAALRDRDLQLIDRVHAGETPSVKTDETADLARRIRRAQRFYQRSEDAAGTPVETYLRSRGITLELPMLRFLRWCSHRNDSAYPAMVAPITDIDYAVIGMTATFLCPGGSGKVDLPHNEQRQFYGLVKGGAVRLGGSGEPLLIGEGIESTASAMQLYDFQNGWAALSANGVRTVEVPPEIQDLVIATDNDDEGIDATLSAYRRWSDEGRQVRILVPTDGDNDFNDTLQKRGRA